MSLYIHETGNPNGQPIVFLHAVSTSSWMWMAQAERLADFRCLLVDLPGHGESNQQPWISMQDTASQIAELIRTRAGGKAHIVGLSLGAYVAAQILAGAPEVVDHAILSGLNVLPLPNTPLMKMMGYAMLPFFKTNPFIRMNAESLHIPEAERANYARSVRQTAPSAFLRASSNAVDFRLSQDLKRATCPTLVVAGENEVDLIRQSIALLIQTLPNARGYLAPNVGHGWNGEAPDLFAQMIRAWVEDRPLPPELMPIGASERA
ncbi:MAG: alpha/beta hydrolase [Chloroflexota bacterium]